jgi:hypothetical protein
MASLLLVVGCAAKTGAGPAPAPRGDLAAERGQLPAWLRPIVRTQMARQWDYVNELRWTAASLEFDRTRELAEKIVQEVHCGRPADENAPLDSLVPAGYLDLQEMLRDRAVRLSVVAASGNTRLVTDAYHAMVEVCTRCHSAYRSGPPLELPLISAR